MDGVDIHDRAKQRNFYGPVIFVFDVEIFSQDWLSSLWITKKNPQNWKETDTNSDRYFDSVEDFRQNYKFGDFEKIFVLRHIGGVLRLKPYLQKILLDNPRLSFNGIDIYSQAVGALKATARIGGIENIIIEQRGCQEACNCINQYETMRPETLSKFFVP